MTKVLAIRRATHKSRKKSLPPVRSIKDSNSKGTLFRLCLNPSPGCLGKKLSLSFFVLDLFFVS